MVWILLVLVYGIIKGMREVLKKKALEISSTLEVLFLYTFISFLLVTPEILHAGGVPRQTLLFIAIKSFVIFTAWIAGFTAVRGMAVGIYGILDQSRVIFSMLLGVIVLKETMGLTQIIGLLLVITGLLMLRFAGNTKPDKAAAAKTLKAPSGHMSTIYIVLTLISCFLNALSGLFDKILMSSGKVTDGQLQFWYMLFLVIYYGLYILLQELLYRIRLHRTIIKGAPASSSDAVEAETAGQIKKPDINWRRALRNKWIWLLAILFVIADRCLFIANSYPESKVTVMTLIKQSCCIVTILGGYFVFKEKRLGYRLLCAFIVTAGILVSLI